MQLAAENVVRGVDYGDGHTDDAARIDCVHPQILLIPSTHCHVCNIGIRNDMLVGEVCRNGVLEARISH